MRGLGGGTDRSEAADPMGKIKGRLLAVCWGLFALVGVIGSVEASVKHPSWHAVAQGSVEASPLTLDAGAPVATAARITTVGGVTRLVVDLSAAVAVDVSLIGNPPRAIVDLPEINCQIGTGTPVLAAKPTGLVRSFRCGLFAPGRSRIVVDLDGPAVLRKAGVEPRPGSGARLVVDLGRSDPAAFRALTRRPVFVPPAIDVARPATGSVIAEANRPPVVVIDAGHGGVDPGASGLAGATEKTVVLDFATELAAKLNASARYKVVMTRTGDNFVSLGERVRIARDADAALFVSVHADTLSDSTVTGATVYTASDRASDAEAARVADDENRADEAGGLDSNGQAPVVSDILFDLTRRETRTYAHVFQHTLAGYLQKVAHLNKNPERAAGFKVLQAPDVPSVLLELGYLSSDKDASVLTSGEWRHKATDSVAAAIDAFFARRLPTAPGEAARTPPSEATRPSGTLLVSAGSHP